MINRFAKGLRDYDTHALAQKKIIDRVVSMLDVDRKYGKVLEIGCGSGNLSVRLSGMDVAELYLNDLCPEVQDVVRKKVPEAANLHFEIGNAETLTFGHLVSSLDMVISTSVFQWIENTGLLFEKVYSLLNEEGIFVFSTFVPGTFEEIRKTCGIGIDYLPEETVVGQLERAGFTVRHSVQEDIVLRFKTPYDVLRHIRSTGVNSIEKVKWTKGDFDRFCFGYDSLFADENGVSLTYRPLYVFAEKGGRR